jgi:hypothetical protein
MMRGYTGPDLSFIKATVFGAAAVGWEAVRAALPRPAGGHVADGHPHRLVSGVKHSVRGQWLFGRAAGVSLDVLVRALRPGGFGAAHRVVRNMA